MHKAPSPLDLIRIRGARQNNLKNIDLDITPHTWTVITGPSGSGKSSLAFDTLYAEGQRRYVETFSPYARQFLDRCDRPLVDRIDGVPPAIAINQSNSVRTSRSTVGTMTELNDHLKLLFAREANLFCRNCGEPVRKMSAFDMWRDICERAARAGDPRLIITFDVFVPKTLEKTLAIDSLASQGFTKIHGERATRTGTVLSVVIDRFRASKAGMTRGIEAVESALRHGTGDYAEKFVVHALIDDGAEILWPYATGLCCATCAISYAEPSAPRFSFNSPLGACPTCRGFGQTIGIDMGLIVPDESKTLVGGCVKPWSGSGSSRDYQREMLRYAKRDRIRVDVPYRDLAERERTWLIEGEPGWSGKWSRQWYGIRHFFEYLETKAYKLHVRAMLSRYRSYTTCPVCEGARLKTEALLWRVGSRAAADAAMRGAPRYVPQDAPGIREKIQSLPGLTIHDLMLRPITDVARFFDVLQEEVRDEASRLVLDQIRSRLGYLVDVGVGYLTLDRQSRTLSGGEVQRVNLTTALGTNLVDTLFVLDEPSVGLHPRDMDRVNAILRGLRDAGNTLVVVEHDPQVMLAADRIVDMGPGAGEQGGSIVYNGPSGEIRQAETLTGLYLSGKLRVDQQLSHRKPSVRAHWLELTGATEHNLKSITVRFPIGYMTTVTGVSGSGKSTLVVDTLVPALKRSLGRPASGGAYDKLNGSGSIADVHLLDQSALSKTTRSNPALYVGAFSAIRHLFANTSKAHARNYGAEYFSFNCDEGRCPTCQGAGFECVEMQFLSDVYLRCPDCDGKRFRPEILEVTICLDGKHEKNIADVLEMTVREALFYFRNCQEICRMLLPLKEVGLDYIRLGQPLTTLSGGEAQRIKLAEILAKTSRLGAIAGHVYVLDEPTTGLHFDDIAKLLAALRCLVANGATVILVEHNLDVINASDWVIDLGPEGGEDGGYVIATGTPDGFASKKATYTGIALAAYRETLTSERADMTGLFCQARELPCNPGRSLQSVWRAARAGDMGIFGAREHNLKGIDVVIPKRKFSVLTGVSGSGKSTLAFGIVFSEGQRRYLESLNAYARSIVQPNTKPDVDSVVNIAPTVAIEQRTSRGGHKSTVATLTEIHHFLRLLYVKLGVQHCPVCGVPVRPQSFEAIFAEILKTMQGRRVSFAAPLVVSRKGLYTELAQWARARGILELRVDGDWVSTEYFPSLSRYAEHTIEMPVDTFVVNRLKEFEIRTALKSALFHGHGVVTVLWGNLAANAKKESDGGHVTYSTKHACPICAQSFPDPDPRLFSYNNKIGWCPKCFGTGRVLAGFNALQTGEENEWKDAESILCPDCQGQRLNPVARSVYFEGKSICEVTALSVDACAKYIGSIRLLGRAKAIGGDAIKEILSRLAFLHEVGLGYLELDRDAPSLSGGEAQRIRLAAQLGSTLQGVCYILDEPTIGLHARDNARLITSLVNLKNKGNTVLVVEHDEQTIRRAEHIIDIGPGAGSQGGELVVEGTLGELLHCDRSLTGSLLKHPVAHPSRPRRPLLTTDQHLTVRKASLHNLRDITVEIPLERLTVLTGVSGSGKSTLARDVLLANLTTLLAQKDGTPLACVGCEAIEGIDAIDRVLEVDQSPIGKTSRSCPATYVGFFNQIRDLFAGTNEAKERGWQATRFSFNTEEGRCPLCQGQGEITVEMNFLPDVKIPCEACAGMRFDKETLAVKWHGKSIGEILNTSVDDALPLFEAHPKIGSALRLMQDVGLGYLKLGQPSSTLSGGEAQRIKLITELTKSLTVDLRRVRCRHPKTLYVLDEPTVGLHMADVQKLITVLHRLVDAGNTVLVVEHNMDIIAEADCVIDLGPEGGPEGGTLLAQGTPETLAHCQSATGIALAEFLQDHSLQSARTTKDPS